MQGHTPGLHGMSGGTEAVKQGIKDPPLPGIGDLSSAPSTLHRRAVSRPTRPNGLSVKRMILGVLPQMTKHPRLCGRYSSRGKVIDTLGSVNGKHFDS